MISQPSLSRRRFLLQAAVATSAPFLLPSWAGQTAPGERINIGCIGLGPQGRGLMGGFLSRPAAQVVAVCDVDTHRREDGRKHVDAHPKVQLYRSPDHLNDWLTAIRRRQKPICDVETGARTATVCHLVNLAYYHGQPMKWNPAREKFVGGTGGPNWLDVPHRAPWKVG